MTIETKDIIAYLEKRLPDEELALFESQIKDSEDFRKEVEEVAFVWRVSSDFKLCKEVDTEKNWKVVSNKIRREKYQQNALHFFRSTAAVLLIPVIALSVFLYLKLNTPLSVNQQVELTSAYGIVSKAVLPDGTEVWLNSGSKLVYPQAFTDKRIVKLTGEAYFKVKSDKSNRFDVVMPNNMIVSAYGTEFNIDAYQEDNTIDVTLVEGNVEIKEVDSSVNRYLLPGQQFKYDKAEKLIEVGDVNLAVKTGWKDGKIIFRRASMTDVTQRLSRHFNVDIRLEGKELYTYEYSATFTTESLDEILYLLRKTAPIDYTIIESKQSGDYSFSKRIVIIKQTK